MKYPLIIKWSITDKCNLNCKHCFKSQKITSVTKEQAALVINDLIRNKVACVALTGGEPLAAPNFWYILRELSARGIKTELATNGTLLTDKTIRRIKEYGITHVQISLEGPDSNSNDYIRGHGTYDKIIESIKGLKDEKISVTLAVTLTHLNCLRIDEFVQLKVKNNVDYLRFELYIPVQNDEHSLLLTKSDIQGICGFIKKYRKDGSIIFPQLSSNNTCGAGVYMGMINSDLSLSPCDLLCDELRTETTISKERGIRYIWNTDQSLVAWRSKTYAGCGASIIKNKTPNDFFSEVYNSGKAD